MQVTDNSGNVSVSSVKLDIDSSEPEIYLYYDNNSPYKIVSDRGYYPAERTATLVVVERNHHFSAEDLKNGIVIQMSVNGERVIACGTWACPEFFDAFREALQ